MSFHGAVLEAARNHYDKANLRMFITCIVAVNENEVSSLGAALTPFVSRHSKEGDTLDTITLSIGSRAIPDLCITDTEVKGTCTVKGFSATFSVPLIAIVEIKTPDLADGSQSLAFAVSIEALKNYLPPEEKPKKPTLTIVK